MGIDYNYLYGLIRSRENELIDPSLLRSLIGMKSVDEIGQIYPESSFVEAFAPDFDEQSLWRAVAFEQAQLRSLIDQHAPQVELRELLLVPRDLYNLKVGLRIDSAVREVEETGFLYGPPGLHSVEAIQAAITGNGTPNISASDTNPANRVIAMVLERALSAFYRADRNGQVLEMAIDRLIHLYRVKTTTAVAPEVGAAFAGYAAIAVGELLVRGRAAQLPWDVLKWGLIDLPGQADLEILYETPLGEWSSGVSIFSGPLRVLIEHVVEGVDISSAVRTQQDLIDGRVANWKLAPPSFAFAVYYLQKKQADMDALRMICLAKIKGVIDDNIRSRLEGALMQQFSAA